MRTALALALLLALIGCAPAPRVGGAAAPATDRLALAVGSADAVYITASRTAQLLTSQGLMTDAKRRALDGRAYAALLALRATAAAIRAGTVPLGDLAPATVRLNSATAAMTASQPEGD